jgi:hypothetical protein
MIMDKNLEFLHKECDLCGRDYKSGKNQFGVTCCDHILDILDINEKIRDKNKLKYIEDYILNDIIVSDIESNQKAILINQYLSLKYLEKLNFSKELKEKYKQSIEARNVQLKDVYKVYKDDLTLWQKIEKVVDEKNFIIGDFLAVLSFFKNYNRFKNKDVLYQEYVKEQIRTVLNLLIDRAEAVLENCPFAVEMLRHSLQEKPTDVYVENNVYIDKIKNNGNFQKSLKEIVDKNKNRNDFLTIGGMRKC